MFMLNAIYGPDDPRTRAAIMAHAEAVVIEEAANPEHGLYWLSFVRVDPPPDLFLGVVIIRSIGHTSAITEASVLGLNPGGEVQSLGPMPVDAIDPEWCNRLLTKDEAMSIPEPPP